MIELGALDVQGRASIAPESQCVHCGLPVGTHPLVRGDELFCCIGCAAVRDALKSAGFLGTYDRLRPLGNLRSASRPVAPDTLATSELDTEAFLSEQTRETADGREVELFVDGVHCAACVWLVERLPMEMDGVSAARLDLPRARLKVTFDPDRVHLSAVADWLARFGYAARPLRADMAGKQTDAERRLLIRTGVAWALAGNVMLVAFALYSGLNAETDPELATAARWASLLLTIPSVTYGAAPFFQRAWASVRMALSARSLKNLHMDTPIALGIAVGFLHSTWATVSGQGDVWFDSIAVLVAALLTARWLQLRSRRLAGEAGERLLSLIPTMARRVASAKVELIRADQLRLDDIVEVGAGDVIPVDGVVAEGESDLNNAVLTGESRLVPVAYGDRVDAGTTNLTSILRVRVGATGAETRVGRLLAAVRDGDRARAPVVLVADRLGGAFVVTVLSLSVLTAAVWLWLAPSQAVAHVVALLVVTCPCALGMATPLSMAVAAGRAARSGLFIKSDEATQRLTDINTVVLDKTGTLTEGRMTVARVVGDESTLDLAAALEAQSAHPIAAAILRACPARDDLTVRNVETTTGQGIRGFVAGIDVMVGKPSWVEAETGALPEELAFAVGEAAAKCLTPVVVAVEGMSRAVLGVGDRLRDEAVELVRDLEARGMDVHILSGDHPAVVLSIARQLGLPEGNARGGVDPNEKRDAVLRLQAGGRVVLMVGDGVNDAAALQAADVGVAVGGGATASLVAADVFVLRPGVQPVADLLTGSRDVMRTIRQTLGVSLVYNVVGAAAAMAGIVTPLVAAVAMPVSSLVVVTMAMTQRSFRTTPHPS